MQFMLRESLESVHLHRLVRLRWLAIAGQLAAVLGAHFGLGLALPLPLMLALVTALAILNTATAVWLRRSRRVVRQRGLALQLLADLAVLTGLLYLSGGHANPFVFMLLPLLAIGAAALSGWYSAAIALVAVGCYSLLLVSFVPLPALRDWSGPLTLAGLQRVGVWTCFVLSASMIVYFVLRTRESLRAHEQAAVADRERALRQAHLATLGTLAANTAHEMASPLATIRLLVDEMKSEPAADTEEDTGRHEELARQVDRCQQALLQLLEATGQPHATRGRPARPDEHLRSLVARWRQRHPNIRFTLNLPEPVPQRPPIVLDRSLEQALTHLADNAARVGNEVVVDVAWELTRLRVQLTDDGPGLPGSLRGRLGREPLAGDPEARGQGLGCYLAQAAIERFDGTLVFESSDSVGVTATIELPLPGITPEMEAVRDEPIPAAR